MHFLETALQWYNLLFILPFLGAGFYLMLLASGLTTAEHDADADLDHDVDFDHDADTDISHDVGHDYDHDLSHIEEPGPLLRALSFLGVGKVPVSILMMSFCFIWGFTGLASNRMFGSIFPIPSLLAIVSIAIASVSSIFGTSFLARGLAKIMPSTESYGTRNRDLVGLNATSRFEITTSSGTARLYDQYNNYQSVPCRVASGEKPIPADAPVILIRYEEKEKAFIVRPDPLAQNRAKLPPHVA